MPIDGATTSQFRRFLVAGGVAACANVGSRALFEHVVPYRVAVVLAYLVGMLVAYALTSTFVFMSESRRHGESSARFVLVNFLGMAQTWIVSVGLGDHLLPRIGVTEHAHAVAHLAGVATPVFTSFVLHRAWTFADRKDAAAATDDALASVDGQDEG
jgi:putative flippase GtrA